METNQGLVQIMINHGLLTYAGETIATLLTSALISTQLSAQEGPLVVGLNEHTVGAKEDLEWGSYSNTWGTGSTHLLDLFRLLIKLDHQKPSQSEPIDADGDEDEDDDEGDGGSGEEGEEELSEVGGDVDKIPNKNFGKTFELINPETVTFLIGPPVQDPENVMSTVNVLNRVVTSDARKYAHFGGFIFLHEVDSGPCLEVWERRNSRM
ncbi:hypothetical protein BVC80_8535g5 [Macleaya cordata]|uniref:Uncharacterized protein n=1 Tax=Macleaya cordata TaxID=56857 RepID=A0A200PQE0_MACCD|nr:hypothetical protein BVC80_8535g5 [Macleaya cordata]